MSDKKPSYKRPNSNQCTIIRRRGLDPINYVVLKETYTSLYLRDQRDGTVKIITKNN